MGKFEDLTGRKFGRLTAKRRVGSDIHKNALWECSCECGSGTTVIVTATHLKRGHTNSCGCYKRDRSSEAHKRYPDSDSRYLGVKVLSSMKDRCNNPRSTAYPNYGGRGIKICDEWMKDPFAFINWSKTNGWKRGLSIDRIDVNGPYNPENCRWVTEDVQANNKRCCRYVDINGIVGTLSEWNRALGLPKSRLHQLTDEKAEELIRLKLMERGGSPI